MYSCFKCHQLESRNETGYNVLCLHINCFSDVVVHDVTDEPITDADIAQLRNEGEYLTNIKNSDEEEAQIIFQFIINIQKRLWELDLADENKAHVNSMNRGGLSHAEEGCKVDFTPRNPERPTREEFAAAQHSIGYPIVLPIALNFSDPENKHMLTTKSDVISYEDHERICRTLLCPTGAVGEIRKREGEVVERTQTTSQTLGVLTLNIWVTGAEDLVLQTTKSILRDTALRFSIILFASIPQLLFV